MSWDRPDSMPSGKSYDICHRKGWPQPVTPYYLVDAFTDHPFGGNPAAVCLLPAWRETAWLQAVSAEMNKPETSFLVQSAPNVFDLRWFTPTVEIDLCGHATLAAAHALADLDPKYACELRFQTKSGVLITRPVGSQFELDFPATPGKPTATPEHLIESLNVTPRTVLRSPFDFLVEVDSESVVRSLNPDLTRLAKIPCRGVIVTAPADSGEFDFVSRFFAPASGTNEDPATGSAHCCLAPFWAPRLQKTEFRAYQASPRGGVLGVRLAGDRVFLTGSSVIIAKGSLVL